MLAPEAIPVSDPFMKKIWDHLLAIFVLHFSGFPTSSFSSGETNHTQLTMDP